MDNDEAVKKIQSVKPKTHAKPSWKTCSKNHLLANIRIELLNHFGKWGVELHRHTHISPALIGIHKSLTLLGGQLYTSHSSEKNLKKVHFHVNGLKVDWIFKSISSPSPRGFLDYVFKGISNHLSILMVVWCGGGILLLSGFWCWYRQLCPHIIFPKTLPENLKVSIFHLFFCTRSHRLW